jgi:hypothetical protein
MQPKRIAFSLVVDRSREYPVPTALAQYAPSTADLIALALSHRLQAERSTCPEEQVELHRVADIYQVLATIDFPTPTVAQVEGTANATGAQFVDVFE